MTVTGTEATAASTRTTMKLDFPSLVAVMLAVPGATPVMSPVAAFTVATAALLVPQATGRPVSVLLLASFSTAVA